MAFVPSARGVFIGIIGIFLVTSVLVAAHGKGVAEISVDSPSRIAQVPWVYPVPNASAYTVQSNRFVRYVPPAIPIHTSLSRGGPQGVSQVANTVHAEPAVYPSTTHKQPAVVAGSSHFIPAPVSIIPPPVAQPSVLTGGQVGKSGFFPCGVPSAEAAGSAAGCPQPSGDGNDQQGKDGKNDKNKEDKDKEEKKEDKDKEEKKEDKDKEGDDKGDDKGDGKGDDKDQKDEGKEGDGDKDKEGKDDQSDEKPEDKGEGEDGKKEDDKQQGNSTEPQE